MSFYRVLLTFALYVFAVWTHAQESSMSMKQQVFSAQSQLEKYDYFRAIHACKDILAAIENSGSSDLANEIACLYVLEKSYGALQDPVAAENVLNRIIKIQENSPDESHIDIAETLERLANVYAKKNENSKYQPTIQRAVSIREAYVEKLKNKNPPDDENVAKQLALIAEDIRYVPYKNMNSENLYVRVLEIRKKIYGINHVEVAKTLERIAYLDFSKHKLKEAESAYLEAYDIRTKISGEDDHQALDTQEMLALVYADNREYKKAINLSKKILEGRRRVYGEDSLEVARSLGQLATLKTLESKSAGGNKEVAQLRERALNIRKQVLGEYHPLVEDALVSLESTYLVLGNESRLKEIREERSKVLLKQVEILKAEFGENSLSVAYCMAKWSAAYSDTDREKAESYLNGVVSIREHWLGEDNSSVISGLKNLKDFYKKTGQKEKADIIDNRINRALMSENKL